MTIQTGTRWTHNREGYAVEVVPVGNSSTAKVKDANDAAWQQAVAYRRFDEGDNDSPLGSTVYVRSEADFLAKFTADPPLRDEGDL